jgi:prepilin-type processing-associated H-X9-DG protein
MIPSAHARGLNVLFADGHAKYAFFQNRPGGISQEPCLENWWTLYGWQGFYE